MPLLNLKKDRPKNFIPDDKIEKIAKVFHDWKSIDKFTKIITKEEAAKNDYNLSPSRYVSNGKEEEYQDVEEILVELAELEEDREKTDKRTKRDNEENHTKRIFERKNENQSSNRKRFQGD